MKPRAVLYVTANAALPAGWEAGWGAVRVVAPGGVRAALRSARADVALVDGAVSDPLACVRELHGADPTLLPIVLAQPAARLGLERALLFATGVRETWIAAPEELGAELLERAWTITRSRRKYRNVRRRLSDTVIQGGRREARPFVTDAYLAALLQVLPDPTAATDADGRVLFWSPAAEQVLGVPAESALGQPFHVLVGIDEEPWQGLLQRAATGPVRSEVQYRVASGDARMGVIGVAPITIGGLQARATTLHDVTEERRASERLGQQAELLERQAAELAERADVLARLAAERSDLLAEREHTLRELRHAMDVRTRFYAAMNHELRTPLNALIGYTDLLLAGTYGELSASQQRALQQSRRAAEHLIDMVTDLLDLSRLEAGRVELQIAPVALGELIRDLLATTRPLAAERGSELITELTPDCPQSIITDPRRVRQILLNLLSNAVKFGEGRPIRMRCSSSGSGRIALEVEDQGIGIAGEDLGRIFEEFVQVSKSSTGGTGLGLPISRRLADALDGRLSVRSRPGEGSTFRLELPLRPRSMGRAGALAGEGTN
jgi:PAS domain S-box-containing protein